MSKHTPTPWMVTDDFIGIWKDGKQIASLDSEGSPDIDADESIANAKRIIACVNACEGIPTVELLMDNSVFILGLNERMALKKRIEELTAELESAKSHSRPAVIPEIDVDRQQLLMDILCTAAEGGINYWCKPHKIVYDRHGDYLALIGCVDAEDGENKFDDITLATIELGISRIISGAVPIRDDLLAQVAQSWATNSGDCDIDAADCIVQAGLFNEIIYC